MDRRCVDHRASGVHTDYERHARQLDAAHHIADPAARPIFLRLTQEFPRVRGQVFGECSADVHALLRETATAAAAREWRESGASSHETRRELPTFPSSAAAGAAPSRSPVLASGCVTGVPRGG